MLAIKRGDTYAIEVILENNGVPVDLTGLSLYGQLKARGALVTEFIFTPLDLPAGKVTMTFATATDNFPAGIACFDILVVDDSTGDRIHTSIGEILIEETITKI
jgi:hypothetical protein